MYLRAKGRGRTKASHVHAVTRARTHTCLHLLQRSSRWCSSILTGAVLTTVPHTAIRRPMWLDPMRPIVGLSACGLGSRL